MIVGRSDLSNPNVAAMRGYNYRLVEFGFITNEKDLAVFNSRMDEIAKGVLEAFGIVPEVPGNKNGIINAAVRENSGADFMRLKFEAVDSEDKIFRIRDKANGYLLTAAANKANANVDFRGFDCGDYQKWKIIDKQYKNADYKMLECAAAPGLYLSVENNGNGGKNNLKLYTDLHDMKQKFYIREESDGRTLVIHAFSGKCVSAK